MEVKENRMLEALAGNSTPPEQTGLNRGLVAAALTGIVNAVLLFLPLDEQAKTSLFASLNPTIVLVSFVLFGYLERWVKRVE